MVGRSCLWPTLLWLFLSGSAAAADQRVGKETSVSPLAAGTLLETVVGLLLILALIVALGWLVRRYGKLPSAGKGIVTVLGGVSLGPRERAVVLQVGEARLLVGVAPGRVQTLHVLGADGDAMAPGGTEVFSRQLQTQLEGDTP
jgi:flagellar protein FliO/FliZ